MTDTLLILGVIALIAGMVVGVLVRVRLGTRPERHPRGAGLDLGLLETVAVRASRRDAERLAHRLSRERVRTTVAQAPEGWRVLVFPDQAADALVLLHAG